MPPNLSWGAQLPTLDTERVQLRSITSADAPALFEMFSDLEVTRFWSSPPLEDLAGAHQLVADIQELFAQRQLFEWGVVRRSGGPLVGTCTLCQLDAFHRRAEIGFAVARSAWGQGIAREAVERLIEFAFVELGLERLEADVDPDNERSLKLLERKGFRREGVLRKRWRTFGEPRDAVFLGLLREEWTPRFEPVRADSDVGRSSVEAGVESTVEPTFERIVETDVDALHRVRLAVRENRLSDPQRVRPEHYVALLRAGGCGWKAQLDGAVVGFAMGDLERSNVWALFVDPQHEARGIGRRLHEALLDQMFASGAQTLWLTTDPGTRAESFYAAAGWRRCGFEGAEARFELGREAWFGGRRGRDAPRRP